MNIRKMRLDDIEQILLIEQMSFAIPWKKEYFEFELVENKFAHYFVIESDMELIGYCGCWLIDAQMSITNLAILPKYRRKKYGKKLFSYILAFGTANKMTSVILEVRVSNTAAQNLYLKYGLEIISTRKSYYTDNFEDAYVMRGDLKHLLKGTSNERN